MKRLMLRTLVSREEATTIAIFQGTKVLQAGNDNHAMTNIVTALVSQAR